MARNHLPPHLLAPYVTRGAKEVRGGDALSDRAGLAVDEAIQQLEAERDAIGGTEFGSQRDQANVANTSGNSMQLSVLALSVEGGAGDPESPQDEVLHSSTYLSALVSDLRGLRAGDLDSAGRVEQSFDEMLRQLHSHTGHGDII